MARKCHSFLIHMQVNTCEEGDYMLYTKWKPECIVNIAVIVEE